MSCDEKKEDEQPVVYSSKVVTLPPTVTDLIKEFEDLYKRYKEVRSKLEFAQEELLELSKNGKGVGGVSPPPSVSEGKVIKGKVLVGGYTNTKEGTQVLSSQIVAKPVTVAEPAAVDGAKSLRLEIASEKIQNTLIADLKAELEGEKKKLEEFLSAENQVADHIQQNYQLESVVFEKDQCRKKLEDALKEIKFLKEKNNIVEGQLQRLLTSGLGAEEQPKPAPTPAPAPAAAPNVPAAFKGFFGGNDDEDTLNSLRDEIDSLKTKLEKSRAQLKKENQRRLKIEEVNKTMNQEMADMRNSLQCFQRERNEKELDIVREVAIADEENRIKALEKECIKLKTMLREKKDVFNQEKLVLEEQIHRVELANKVYNVAVAQLQSKLFEKQIKEIALNNCCHQANAFSTAVGNREQQKDLKKGHVLPVERSLDVYTDDNVNHVSNSENTVTPSDAHAEGGAKEVRKSDFDNVSESPSERDKMLDELKIIYERRLESVEATKKAELKRLVQHNRELKEALASCQEEIQQKSKTIFQLQRANRQSILSETTPNRFYPQSNSVSPEVSMGSVPPNSTAAAEGGVLSPSQSTTLTQLESRYDPENMTETEAVQLENEALLQRLTIMQEEKWSMSGHIEDLQQRCAAQQEELRIQSNVLNHILEVKNSTLGPANSGAPSFPGGGNDDGAKNLKFLQNLLQEMLEKNMKLESELQSLRLTADKR